MSRPAGYWGFFQSDIYVWIQSARYAEEHKLLMCWSIDRVLSKKTPKFFKYGFNKMFFHLSGQTQLLLAL